MPAKPQVLFAPANPSQRKAKSLWPDCDVLFLLGPAGAGKTHAALALALADCVAGRADRVLITRPLVGCGEDLGYLPGSVAEKLAPWFGAIADVLPGISLGEVKDLPLEYTSLAMMRGRTVSKAVGILDEAQNATLPQLRMFLSRIGNGGKLVICGDPDQSDLPRGQQVLSRLVSALTGLARVGVVRMPSAHVVRHPLIPKILSRIVELP